MVIKEVSCFCFISFVMEQLIEYRVYPTWKPCEFCMEENAEVINFFPILP